MSRSPAPHSAGNPRPAGGPSVAAALVLATALAAALAGCTNIFSNAASVVNNRRTLEDPWVVATSGNLEQLGHPQIVDLGGGRAMALWLETRSSPDFELFAAVVDDEGAVGAERKIAPVAAVNVASFEAVGDGRGRVAVVYSTSGPANEVGAVIYGGEGGAWGTTTVLNSTLPSVVGIPSIAIDDSGRILATWSQDVAGETGTYTIFYTSAGGWSLPFETDGGADDVVASGNSDTVVASDGTFHVAWCQDSAGNAFFHTRRFLPQTKSWDPEVVHDLCDGFSRRTIDLVPLPGGGVYAVWSSGAGPPIDLLSRRYSPAGGWGGIEVVDGDGMLSNPGWVVADAQGDEVSVGYLKDVGGNPNLHFARNAEGGWSAPLPVTDTISVAVTRDFDIAIDRQGGTILARRESEAAVNDLVVNRFSPSSGLGLNRTLDGSTVSLPAYPPAVTSTGDGTTYILFVEQEGNYQVLYSLILRS